MSKVMDEIKLVVDSKALRENYDATLHAICKDLWSGVLAATQTLVDENGSPVKLNVADICNVLTNVVQRHRADHQASEA